ncbi:MAG: hypothetical protein ISQ07_08475 [Pirellulales bacterium]|jgi:hypothetical protein|nr:hypothetical protein [Pirellulales bacterium]
MVTGGGRDFGLHARETGFLDATPLRTYNSIAGMIEMAFPGNPRNEDR